MVYSLGYRRPALVNATSVSLSTHTDREGSVYSSSTGSTIHGIPEALSFDRVISGGTCPPCTTRDFMNYLIYIELAAENLQFFLWLKDYARRFSQLPSSEKVLSQPWISEKDASRSQRIRPLPRAATPDIFKGSDFESKEYLSEKIINPFDEEHSSCQDSSTYQNSIQQDSKSTVAVAFEAADIKVQPFTVQPFREEINRIIAIYIIDDAPRQLNLAARERKELLQALATTTHPSAFQEVLRTVEWTLRHQAHPNFIRWTICNGNRPRVLFARSLGVGTIAAGFACLIILTLSSAFRPWRVIAMLPLIIGIATLFAAWKGMCVVLHGMHHRHLRPWELFVDADDARSTNVMNYSMDSFGSANSYEDEPWVARYEKRNVVRKVFDREVWIQEPALRQIQDTIFFQALLSATIASAVIVGAFCAVPQLNKF